MAAVIDGGGGRGPDHVQVIVILPRGRSVGFVWLPRAVHPPQGYSVTSLACIHLPVRCK